MERKEETRERRVTRGRELVEGKEETRERRVTRGRELVERKEETRERRVTRGRGCSASVRFSFPSFRESGSRKMFERKFSPSFSILVYNLPDIFPFSSLIVWYIFLSSKNTSF